RVDDGLGAVGVLVHLGAVRLDVDLAAVGAGVHLGAVGQRLLLAALAVGDFLVRPGRRAGLGGLGGHRVVEHLLLRVDLVLVVLLLVRRQVLADDPLALAVLVDLVGGDDGVLAVGVALLHLRAVGERVGAGVHLGVGAR